MKDVPPSTSTLVELRDRHDNRFRDAISSSNPFATGMWYSELFIFALMCEYLDCDSIIESGRARGVSTEILSQYFEDSIEITSIDNRPNSEDAKIAEEKLAGARNVELKYGDSTSILSDLVGEQTAVLIDGPKNDTALQLAIELLENHNVPLVAIHDLDKDRLHRDLSELIFTNNLYTDQEDLVEAFRQYDKKLHKWFKKNREGIHGPYLKNGEKLSSYGWTLGLFFNGSSPIDHRVKNNYYQYNNHSTQELLARVLRNERNKGGMRRYVAEAGLKLGWKIVG